MGAYWLARDNVRFGVGWFPGEPETWMKTKRVKGVKGVFNLQLPCDQPKQYCAFHRYSGVPGAAISAPKCHPQSLSKIYISSHPLRHHDHNPKPLAYIRHLCNHRQRHQLRKALFYFVGGVMRRQFLCMRQLPSLPLRAS